MNAQNTIKRFYEAATAQDARALRSLLTDEFRFVGPIGNFDNPDDYVSHLVSVEGYVDASRTITEGNRVVHLGVFHMTSPGKADIPMCDVFTLEGDKIAHQELYTDTKLFPTPD